MRIYTVHEPPARRPESRRGPDNFLFVRDGFYFWAFLFGPLWLIYRRLWLVLLGYVVLMVAVGFALHFLGIAGSNASFVHFLLSVLVGLEAGTLWRWTLRRRGWRERAVIAAPNMEAAERRFFDAWQSEADATPLPPVHGAPFAYPVPAPARAAASPDVVGLFPEPGTPR